MDYLTQILVLFIVGLAIGFGVHHLATKKHPDETEGE